MKRVLWWLSLIKQSRCPCAGCKGALTASQQYPGWERCRSCDCHWTVSVIHDQLREGVYRSSQCNQARSG